RLPAHVVLPAIASALASAAGIFFAAERAADLGAARAGVHVRDTTITSDRAYEFLSLADVICEDRRGQSLRHIIVDRDCFIEIAIRRQIEDRKSTRLNSSH